MAVKEEKTVTVGRTVFKVEAVKTAEEKSKGLAGHVPLKDNEGMLFVFNGREPTVFWMKGMTFPIDIIWIKNNKVFYILEDAPIPKPRQVLSELPVYSPPGFADYVLEVKAGMVKKYNIKVSDKFNF